jgi:hypothetical protein
MGTEEREARVRASLRRETPVLGDVFMGKGEGLEGHCRSESPEEGRSHNSTMASTEVLLGEH